jgi:thiol-disulfide isomerase/thioredoxin
MNYHNIESLEDYYLLHTTCDRDIILYTASWCKPCKALKKFLHETYPDLGIPLLIVDVENQDLSDLVSNVRAMPTLDFYEKGDVKHRIEGFDKEQIQTLLDQWLL